MASIDEQLTLSLGVDLDRSSFRKAIGALKTLKKQASAVSKKIIADTGSKMWSGFRKAGDEQRKVAADWVKSTFTMRNAAFAAVGGIAAVAKGTYDMVNATVDSASAIVDMSTKFGIGVESLQEWDYVASQAGSNIDQMGAGFQKLAVNMQAARNGSAETRKAFKALGLTSEDLKSDDLDATMLKVADGLRAIENPAKRLAIAQKVMGKGGGALLPALLQGSDDIKAQRAKVNPMKGEDARNLEGFGDKLGDVKRVLTETRNAIVIALLPAMQRVVDKITPWLQANRELVAEKVADFIKDLATFVWDFGKALKEAYDILKPVAKMIWSVVDALGGLKTIIIGLLVYKATAFFVSMGAAALGAAGKIAKYAKELRAAAGISTMGLGPAGAAGAGGKAAAGGLLQAGGMLIAKASMVALAGYIGYEFGTWLSQWTTKPLVSALEHVFGKRTTTEEDFNDSLDEQGAARFGSTANVTKKSRLNREIAKGNTDAMAEMAALKSEEQYRQIKERRAGIEGEGGFYQDMLRNQIAGETKGMAWDDMVAAAQRGDTKGFTDARKQISMLLRIDTVGAVDLVKATVTEQNGVMLRDASANVGATK